MFDRLSLANCRSLFPVGCRADTDCPPEKSCINGDCIDPCAYTQCGINALCRTDGYHRARCYCPPAYDGNPFTECRRPECTTDSDCPSTLACRNQHCQSPCDCAPTALCNVANHIAACRCPPGYIGNPHVSCTLRTSWFVFNTFDMSNEQNYVITHDYNVFLSIIFYLSAPLDIPPQCTMDSDCASKLACFDGNCRNPCYETKPCGAHAECIVIDTLPHRTMSCQCIPGYVGDADVQCKLGNIIEFFFFKTNKAHKIINIQCIVHLQLNIYKQNTIWLLITFYVISDFSAVCFL